MSNNTLQIVNKQVTLNSIQLYWLTDLVVSHNASNRLKILELENKGKKLSFFDVKNYYEVIDNLTQHIQRLNDDIEFHDKIINELKNASLA